MMNAMQVRAQRTDEIERFDEFADDLLAERGIRPLAILGAAKVDDLLLEILRRYLLPKAARPKEPDELLEGGDSSPLSTFSSRIKMCRRLGLIDQGLAQVLDQIRRIRNDGAHSLSFGKPSSPVRDRFSEIKKAVTGRTFYLLTQKRYFGDAALSDVEEWQCLFLAVCVLLESIRKSLRPTRGNRRALSIAASR
ncbi:MAG: DUF4145 domain-containing protein [Terracidiphilus sp.]